MGRAFVVTPPAPFLTPEQVRPHLRVDHEDDDPLIAGYIDAAIAHIDGPDGWLGRAIGAQVLEYRADRFDGQIKLPYTPIVSVSSVKYLDDTDVEQSVSGSDYSLVSDSIVLASGASWPSTSCQPESVRVRYAAGWSAAPAPIIAAVKIMVADIYAQRETIGPSVSEAPVSLTAQSLLRPYWRMR